MKNLSQQRLELLCAIHRLKPDSIYELSLSLKKSQPYLQKEVKFLESKGLVSLKKSKNNGRVRLKPEILYTALTIEMAF